MTVRAKFFVTEKDEHDRGGNVVLEPVYDGSEENKKFFEATPGGKIDLNILNLDALKKFEKGKSYYVDFTLAD